MASSRISRRYLDSHLHDYSNHYFSRGDNRFKHRDCTTRAPINLVFMHHSTYLPLPTLESLAHSGSSSSASSRSSISLFNVDPQPSDSQTDASPLQTPEEAFPGDLSVSMAPHLKFLLPDHLSRLGLKTTPKQRLFMQRSNWSNKKDDMGYDSERESCISTARRDRAKVFTRKRGVPSRCQGLEVTRPSSEAKDTCEPEAPPQHVCLFCVISSLSI